MHNRLYSGNVGLLGYMGGSQNYGPFLGTLIRCRIIIGIQKGPIILTTTQMGLYGAILGLYGGYIGVTQGYIGVVLGLYRGILGLYRGYMGLYTGNIGLYLGYVGVV